MVSDVALIETVEALRRHSVGAGPLEDLLRTPGVTDILVNGPDQVYVDRGAGLELTELRFAHDGEVRQLANGWPLRSVGGWTTRFPSLTPGWPTAPGCTPCWRRWPTRDLPLATGAGTRTSRSTTAAPGALHPGGAELLRRMVAARLAFLISGGTGSGKTTLLGALLALVPAEERIVIVEDSRELDPAHPHVVRLEARPANAERTGEVTLSDLVRQSLRMRPDRLVVGEVRGRDRDLLTALNTGHEGGCGTVHANSAADVPARLEALAALGGLDRNALHAQLASALHAVVHVSRDEAGVRQVSEISVLVRSATTGLVHTERAVLFTPDGRVERGPGGPQLERLLDR